jgi:uncharacterized protein GlcG (DUF336 family)
MRLLPPLLLALAATASPAAPGSLLQRSVSLAQARLLADATQAACHADGRQAVVVVLDRGGQLLLAQRDDAVGAHNLEAARRKAFTALSTGQASRLFAERVRQDPSAQALLQLDSLLLIGGGLPLREGEALIGAIGVGGAGGAVHDEACAAAAIRQLFPTQP